MDDPSSLIDGLEAVAEQHGIVVGLHVYLEDDPLDETGCYVRADRRACVFHPEGVPGIRRSLDCAMTLAHEIGHGLSQEALGTAEYEAYDEAELAFDADRVISSEQKRLILEEEQRAWNCGRALLEGLGFQNWTMFETKVTASLAEYRKRLGLVTPPA